MPRRNIFYEKKINFLWDVLKLCWRFKNIFYGSKRKKKYFLLFRVVWQKNSRKTKLSELGLLAIWHDWVSLSWFFCLLIFKHQSWHHRTMKIRYQVSLTRYQILLRNSIFDWFHLSSPSYFILFDETRQKIS